MLSPLDVSAWKWLEYLKVFQQMIWKKLFLKFWRKLDIVPAKDIDACHPVGKQVRAILKFLKRKDFQQVLSVKKDIQKITSTDLDLPNTTIKLYLNKSLCPCYRISW